MVETKAQMMVPMLQNILDQAESLRCVVDYQLGLGRDALLDCADRLRKSRRVVLSGMGASLFSSIPLNYWIADHAPLAPVVETSELLHFLSAGLSDGTTVVLVSRSGESVEVVKLLPILREHGIPVIGVVNVADSTLARQADHVVLVSSLADELVAVQTYTGTVLVFALIAAAISNRLEEASSEVETLLRLLPSYFDSCDQSPAAYLTGATPIYFLGRGASVASVQESVLLMHETAKAPAVGMSAAHFRHGPVEAVSQEFRAIVFGTQSSTRELDHGLAVDLKRMGAEVRWVGAKLERSPVDSLSVWPEEVAEWCTTILEIIPVQMLAYRAAEARGIRPGEFRFASPITLSESGFAVSARF
jgi:glucosamine--fructose-6-phosphate aminotransferase (isomerizing)